VQKGIITESMIKEEIRQGHVRTDAMELIKRVA